ncbi:hypothetical protein LCAZH_1113 [Lacticaseibacillus paracasei]|nr:hypothetical protein LCAZH_1113 [Lacticaseibacillus paracasei]AGP67988.1 Hypothetical protein LOCK919_1287 [Lacticaseibacillus paracasei]EPC24499.1 hypothetical protein Lpp46_2533 [Lacticaseibacillus paracasei subsp. paracasei Lpp46]
MVYGATRNSSETTIMAAMQPLISLLTALLKKANYMLATLNNME